MARRLIVHAGMPRAGSSTFQEVLYHYRDRLAREGLLYPALPLEKGESVASVYNHKQLMQAAQAIWPARFKAVHAEIARQMSESDAPAALLSYEGWWDPRNLKALGRSLKFFRDNCGAPEVTILAVLREPASFLLSLYKLDVLHGRTTALFEDYWPEKLKDGRLRYGEILANLEGLCSSLVLLDFDDITCEGRPVARMLDAAGAPGILKRAGVPALESHRSKGAAVFRDEVVSLMLFASRRIGASAVQKRRGEILAAIQKLAASPEHAEACRALKIPLNASAAHVIAAATRAEAEPAWRRLGRKVPESSVEAVENRQTLVEEASALGRALLRALE